MSISPFRSASILIAFFGIAGSFVLSPHVLAQDAATQVEANDDENAPVIPNIQFPSLLSLDTANSVWTLKVTEGVLRVNGDVVVDSPNKGALWMANASLSVVNGKLNVAGNISRLGKTVTDPTPLVGAGIVTDPIPEFLVPNPGKVISQEKLFLQTEEGGDDTVLPPGIYNGGIFASGKGHITLKPGVYVITNGDFSVIGPTVEGKDITIVMAGGKAGTLGFSLGAKFNATAPSLGKMKDLLIVSRASGTLSTGVSFSVASGNMKGLIYAPNSGVSVLSKSTVRVSKIIAKNVDVTGSTLNVDGWTHEATATAGEEPLTAGA